MERQPRAAEACALALGTRANETLVFGAITAGTTLETIAHQFEPVCQWTWRGSIRPRSASCSKPWRALRSSSPTASSSRTGPWIQRTSTIRSNLTSVKTELSVVQNKLNEVQQALKTTLELLRTPQGQREGFPSK
jgi:hypothetical protein